MPTTAIPRRYANLKPPSFDEQDLRAYVIAFAHEHPDEELPTVRALKERFGGGHTRILRIRRAVAADLGREEPLIRSSERARTTRLADQLAGLAAALTPLLTVVKDKAAQPAPIVDWDAVIKSWTFLGKHWEDINDSLDGLEREQVSMTGRQFDLFEMLSLRLQADSHLSEALRGGLHDLRVHQSQQTERLLDAIQGVLQGAASRPSPPKNDSRIEVLERLLSSLQAGQQQLARSVQDLSEQTARKHHGLDSAADRLEAAAQTLTETSASTRQEPTLQRFDEAARTIEQGLRAAADHVQQSMASSQASLTAALDLRISTIDASINAVTAKEQRRTADSDARTQEGIQLISAQLTQFSESLTKAIERQRRAGDRTAARSAEKMSDVLHAVERLARRRPPAGMRLHDDSLEAIDTVLKKRIAGLVRVRKSASKQKPKGTGKGASRSVKARGMQRASKGRGRVTRGTVRPFRR